MRKLVQVLLRSHKCTNWHAATKRLAECEYIGYNSELFEGKHGAGAAHAALDFIKNEQGAHFGAAGAQRLQKGGRRPPHPGIALNGLDDHTCRAGSDLRELSDFVVR